MQIKILAAVFVSVFLAELGDKTQLATLSFASNPESSKVGVFLASSAALVASSLLAVLAGGSLGRFVSPQFLKIGAGVLFILLGLWALLGGLRA